MYFLDNIGHIESNEVISTSYIFDFRAVGSKISRKIFFNASNFTFQNFPTELQSRWLKLVEAEDIDTMNDIAKEKIKIPFVNSIFDWICKPITDYDDFSEFDKKLIPVACKVQVFISFQTVLKIKC
mmetsp:Transcript_8523/g.12706  ORF Transcript_8523/g.12706 Transcript_8523/m.12706 type:complete len:126 (-) Transcript_8523:282-659(-)